MGRRRGGGTLNTVRIFCILDQKIILWLLNNILTQDRKIPTTFKSLSPLPLLMFNVTRLTALRKVIEIIQGAFMLLLYFAALLGTSRALHRPPLDIRFLQHEVDLQTSCPLNIAHRGSSGVLPENTAESFRRAIQDGADVIEIDIAVTFDLKFVCRHEPWLSRSTNIAERPEFADRKRNIAVPTFTGFLNITDWFIADFTLDELLTLKTIQPESFRDPSFDGLFPMATLDEALEITRGANPPRGVYIDLREPTLFNEIFVKFFGTTMEDLLLGTLANFGCTKRSDPCFVSTFDEPSLIRMTEMTELPLIISLDTSEGIDDSKYEQWSDLGFYAVAPWKNQIFPHWNEENGYKNYLQPATDIVERCHSYGLRVHAYTFSNEDESLSWSFGQDPYKELEAYYQIGVDAFFVDFPDTFNNFLKTKVCSKIRRPFPR